MSKHLWKTQPKDIFAASPVMPVMVIQQLDDAIPLAQALVAGGINVLEITLRTPVALEAIKLISQNVKDAIVGAGTIANPAQLHAAEEAGALFAISPGVTRSLLDAASDSDIPLIPGIATLSELMSVMDYGLDHCKFFPAEAAGGIQMLKAIYGPFPQITFCPTGGISPGNYNEYLQLPNVACVGGSWLAPQNFVNEKNWLKITELAQKAVSDAIQV
ncbi:2-dehydro-3-deoxyphosphogluconate aldolase / (4S)-4-hydroxy-2-oxoglutarate aldolase [biofilm metagenome]